jgi:hypothetical protein
MKTRKLIFILGLFSISVFSQKKVVYLNDDLKEITFEEFKKNDDYSKFYNLKIESDSIIANVNVQRIKKDKIPKKVLDSIRTELSINSNTIIPNQNIIVINYFHGIDKCNSSGDKSYVREKYRIYTKKIKKNKTITQFFIYKSPEGIVDYGNDLDWLEDKNKIFERMFLPIHYPCGSFILLDEHGNYYICKGEYDIYSILDLLKNKETFEDTIK